MLAGDLLGRARPAAKATYDIQHARDQPLALRRAFAQARRPPAGPVLLSLPMDLLAEDTEVEVPARTAPPLPGPAAGLDRAAVLLGGAARPAIVAGDGVGREDAVGALVRTAEACGATVHHQPMADCLDFPTTHPLYAGMLSPRHDTIRAALASYDAVLIVGAHAFTPHHYSPGPALPPGITVVQLDSDADEIGRNFPADAGLVGSLAPSLHRLAELLREQVPDHTAKARVLRAGERHTAERARAESAARAAYSAAPLAPWAAAHAVARGLPPDAVIPPGHTGPLPDRCRPDRCGNSMIGPQHVEIWNSEDRSLARLLESPHLAAGHRAALEQQRSEAQAVLRKASR